MKKYEDLTEVDIARSCDPEAFTQFTDRNGDQAHDTMVLKFEKRRQEALRRAKGVMRIISETLAD